MATTYVLLASASPSGVSFVDFTSIPQTYTDLVIRCSGRTTNGSILSTYYIYFNGSNTAVYSNTSMENSGSTSVSSSRTSAYTEITAGYLTGANATASTYANTEIYIPSYANTSFNKCLYSITMPENNAATSYIYNGGGLWRNNSAITSLRVGWSGNIVSDSNFYLYGIKNS